MRVAIVHELLTMKGGAENVAKIFAEMFPDAPIYTLLYDEKKLGGWFPKERVITSTAQNSKLPSARLRTGSAQSFNHHLYLNRFPAAVEAWDFRDFDLVLSSSSAFAHGIITNGNPKHLCYVHSPARYLWDRTHDVLERAGHGLLGPLKRWYLERSFQSLRIWDSEAADRPDALIAASAEVQRRIELYWRRESRIIHPPVDDFWFSKTFASKSIEHPRFALTVSTLVPYKKIDRAMAACKQAGIILKVVGDGPDRKRLESLNDGNTEFCGYRTREEIADLYSNAECLIIPGQEDFCIAALEAMACGTPVLSLRTGGPLETIVEGTTGAFFDEPTAKSLAGALHNFRKLSFDPEVCRARAKEFSRERFEREIRAEIDVVMKR
ncbi:MAG: glycosyltransferase [Candidatus Peregrinibacteria bacterium]